MRFWGTAAKGEANLTSLKVDVKLCFLRVSDL